MSEQTSKLQLLVVEDNRCDLEILEVHFKKMGFAYEMASFRTGEEAVQYLHGRAALEGLSRRTLPDLIFLDLKLPGEDGLEILRKIKTHPTLKTIPVIVMTASTNPEDIAETCQWGRTFFLPKSAEFPVLREMLRQSVAITGAEKNEGMPN